MNTNLPNSLRIYLTFLDFFLFLSAQTFFMRSDATLWALFFRIVTQAFLAALTLFGFFFGA